MPPSRELRRLDSLVTPQARQVAAQAIEAARDTGAKLRALISFLVMLLTISIYCYIMHYMRVICNFWLSTNNMCRTWSAQNGCTCA